MRQLPLLPLLLACCLSVDAQAAPDAAQWLDRLNQAVNAQSFQGTFIYERNGSFSTHQIWHQAVRGSVVERALQLDGSALETVRIGGVARCVSGVLASSVAAAPQTAQIFDPLKLMSWYDLNVAGHSRVAGRQAVIITLTPKDPNRYGVELHLDELTALPLKSLLLGDQGQLLERFQYTTFDSTPPSAAALKPSADCSPVPMASTAPEKRMPAVLGWRFDWLPAGFERSDGWVTPAVDGHPVVTRLLYSDGLARFSVFIEPLQGAQASDARTQVGPTVAVTRRQAAPGGDVMVTVVGEIPMGTAERIALALQPLQANARQ